MAEDKTLLQKLSSMTQYQCFIAASVASGVCLVLFFIVLAVHKSSVLDATEVTTPVLLDVDMTPDDLGAMLLLARRSDVDLRLVTVAGNAFTHLASAHANAHDFLGLIGYNVPAVAGSALSFADSPYVLDGSRPTRHSGLDEDVPSLLDDADFVSPDCTYRKVIPEDVRSAYDSLFGKAFEMAPNMKKPIDTATTTDAALKKAFDDLKFLGKKAVTLVAAGPLTNYARFFKKNPQYIEYVNQLFVTGGALSADGNVDTFYANNSDAELNLFVDPDAVQYLIEGTSIPLVFVPTDVTDAVGFSTTAWGLFDRLRFPNDVSFFGQTVKEWKDYATWKSFTKIAPAPGSALTAALATDKLMRHRSNVFVGGIAVTRSPNEFGSSGVLKQDAKANKKSVVVRQTDEALFNTMFTQLLQVPMPTSSRASWI